MYGHGAHSLGYHALQQGHGTPVCHEFLMFYYPMPKAGYYLAFGIAYA